MLQAAERPEDLHQSGTELLTASWSWGERPTRRMMHWQELQ